MVRRFILLREYLVEFNELAKEAAQGSHDMINRVMTKDNIDDPNVSKYLYKSS